MAFKFSGGAFLIDSQSSIKAECKIRGVTFIEITDEVLNIYSTIKKIIWTSSF